MSDRLWLRATSLPPGVGRCRRCGAEVLWATTRDGKQMPLDRFTPLVTSGGLVGVSTADTHWVRCHSRELGAAPRRPRRGLEPLSERRRWEVSAVTRRFATAEVLSEFARVGRIPLGLEMELHRWFVVAEQLEVALRHPENQGASAAIARAFIADLAARVTPISAVIGAVLSGTPPAAAPEAPLTPQPLPIEQAASVDASEALVAGAVLWRNGSAPGGLARVVLRAVGVDGAATEIALSMPLLQELVAGAARVRGEALATATGDARWREQGTKGGTVG